MKAENKNLWLFTEDVLLTAKYQELRDIFQQVTV